VNHAIILAGGSGTRLWPASRKKRPKQFLPLLGAKGESLLGAVSRRLGQIPGVKRWVVTVEEQRAAVEAATPELKDTIVIEPMARSTAPAIGLATAFVAKSDPQAVLGFIPSDQTVANEKAFADTLVKAFELARTTDLIVTIGIVPTYPATGYGYIETGAAKDGACVVKRFVEKPDLATATRYVAAKNFLWNGGMFFARAQTLQDEFAAHLPAVAALMDAPDTMQARYAELPSISFDYAVMEKSRRILCVPGDFGWNDLGSWNAIADVAGKDDAGNAVIGTAVTLEAKDNVIYAEDTMVAAIGVSNLVIVQSGDAILIVPRDQAEKVRDVVSMLKDKGRGSHL
jgi:mannose-1-phosphate guanylyltransferase